MGHFLLEVLLIYLALSLALTVFMMARMYWVDHKASGKKLGRKRIGELQAEGRWRQLPLYSMDEIAENKKLGTVRLSVFPRKKDTGYRKYAIVLPGGGYAHTIVDGEGYSIASRLNELGVTAFVLEYRTGFNCSPYAPMKDLARTVTYVTEHAEEYDVDPEDYALIGFSAGGNLAGIYGTRPYGWEHYGTKKPGALILGYPWTNINHWMQHPYWNIWEGLIGIWFSERGNFFMFGVRVTKEERESLCVQNWIDETYPPVYMFTGDDDILVKAGSHTDVLAKELKRNKIPLLYERFFQVPHGIGLGVGTNAEGWLDTAVNFWQQSTGWKKGEETAGGLERP